MMQEKNVLIEMKKNLKEQNLTFDEILNYIAKISEKDPTVAEKLLKDIKRKATYTNNPFVKYLLNKIKDEKRQRKMTKEQKEEKEKILDLGRKYLKEEKYDDAINLFEDAYNTTKNPIFKYYLGKSYYYKRNLTLAATNLNDFINISSENFSKANLYLWVISKRTHKYKNRDYRIAILYYLPKVFDCEAPFADLLSELTEVPDKDLVFPKNILLSEKITLSKVSQKEKDSNVISHEREPKILKKDNSEEIFEDFLNIPFNEQMEIIRNLYQSGNLIVADQLLKKAEISATGNKKREKEIKQEKGKRHVYEKKANPR